MFRDKFVPNLDYTEYMLRDLNFEDYCYRAAVEKKSLHSYAYSDKMRVWFNMTFLGLDSDDENLGYCVYIMEFSKESSAEKMSNISGDIASSVLDICIRLRGTNDFRATIRDVIKGIGEMCASEHCCILVMNEMDRDCYVLGEALSEGTKLLPMDNYVNKDFYDIAESWIGTIAGSNCLIAKDESDMLTGVMNRNEMNNYVEKLLSSEKYADSSVAVLFIDMNGLKMINDSSGHQTGDLVLKKAAEVLRKVFDEKEIFRAGGDEFTVIVRDLTEDELNEKIEKIRALCSKDENLSLAIGGCVEKECRNIRMALRMADERMYEDKWRFYEENPDGLLSDRYGLRGRKTRP